MASKIASLSQLKKNTIPGSRVMDLNCLTKNIEVVSNHSSTCGGKCSITREVRREGLASILEIAYSKCKKT